MSVLDYEVPLWAGVLALLVVGVGVDWWMARRDVRRRQAMALTWGGVRHKRTQPPTFIPYLAWRGDIREELEDFDVATVVACTRVFAKDDRTAADLLVGTQTAEEVA